MGKENQFRTVLSVSVSEQIRQNGPEDSSHMNKTVMVDQKLTPTSNWVSRKDAILGVFFFFGYRSSKCAWSADKPDGGRSEFSLVLRFKKAKKT